MDRRLNPVCRPSATPSSPSSLDCRRNDARTAENGLATKSGVSKSAKVVLAPSCLNLSLRVFHFEQTHLDNARQISRLNRVVR